MLDNWTNVPTYCAKNIIRFGGTLLYRCTSVLSKEKIGWYVLYKCTNTLRTKHFVLGMYRVLYKRTNILGTKYLVMTLFG